MAIRACVGGALLLALAPPSHNAQHGARARNGERRRGGTIHSGRLRSGPISCRREPRDLVPAQHGCVHPRDDSRSSARVPPRDHRILRGSAAANGHGEPFAQCLRGSRVAGNAFLLGRWKGRHGLRATQSRRRVPVPGNVEWRIRWRALNATGTGVYRLGALYQPGTFRGKRARLTIVSRSTTRSSCSLTPFAKRCVSLLALLFSTSARSASGGGAERAARCADR